jgi:hypothetical protein
MQQVVDQLAQILSAQPDSVLSLNHIASKRPAVANELPAIAVSLALDIPRAAGFSQVLRSGETRSKQTNVLNVQVAAESFSRDLRRLRVWPLPLRRNPASAGKDWSAIDIEIQNISTTPFRYELKQAPSNKNEYRVDANRGEIVFGQPQTSGERLQISYWTLQWKDQIHVMRYSGIVSLEVWADNLAHLEEILRKLEMKLHPYRGAWKANGFSMLQAASLDSGEQVLHQPPSGSSFSLWKQKLSYRFCYEAEEIPEASSAGPIKKIDVDMEEPVAESFEVPLSL